VKQPDQPPIGFALNQATRRVSRAFDATLSSAGGSLPMWWILLSLRSNPQANQREIAAAAGIQSATLTHHLNAMEANGLVTRRRDTVDRREHVVELTAAGEARFDQLRTAAMTFDARLRTGFDESETAQLRGLLERLATNADGARA
jgi:MarR family transcriptional regulator, transcriptional regulator for hemolysin